jgi:hypothetical protein
MGEAVQLPIIHARRRFYGGEAQDPDEAEAGHDGAQRESENEAMTSDM